MSIELSRSAVVLVAVATSMFVSTESVRGDSRAGNLVRHYSFDAARQTQNKSGVRDRTGGVETLTYVGREPFKVVDGPVPGKKAVRIDSGAFQAKPFAVEDSSFSVTMWVRTHGQGTLLGNGRTNGMFFAQGDGYWNGFRVYKTYPSKQLRFEIGRPKPRNAFGFSTEEGAPDGVWLHLAATWDGHQLRLYLNGLLAGAADYAGDYTVGGPLRIGYANAGIGSLKMDVADVLVYDRALAPIDLLRSAFAGTRRPTLLAIQEPFEAATESLAHADWAAASEHFGKITQRRDVPPDCRVLATLGLARALRAQNRNDEAVSLYAEIADAPDTPDRLRDIAVRMCLKTEHGVVTTAASPAVYGRLLELPDLSPEERIQTRLSLAEGFVQEGNAGKAREQYEAVLQSSQLAERNAWNLQMQIAHAYRSAHDYEAARREYEQVANDSKNAPEYRSIALLSLADTYVREKSYVAAEAAYARLAGLPDLPAHHRHEAEERKREVQRISQGLPPRDPSEHRVKLPSFPKPAVTFHVSPKGNDRNAGTEAEPFASLEGARDAIRRLRASRGLPKGGVTVFVHGGEYVVRQTFELTETDSGTADAPIRYCAAVGETPRFTGGVKWKESEAVTDPNILERLSADARKRVRQIDLKASGVSDYGAVAQRGYGFAAYPTRPWVDFYVGDQAMELARWPNEEFLHVGKVDQGQFRTDQSGKPGRFQYEGDQPNRWSSTEDIWMFGYWGHLWAGRGVKVAAIDKRNRLVTTAHPTSYGFREGMPYYFFNVLDELDRPGEWYLDRTKGVAYFYPPTSKERAEVEFPILATPFLSLRDVSHVTVQGLAFELGRAEGAVVIGGTHNLLAGCTFRKLGTNGAIVQGGTHHGVLGCDIHTLGAGGIRMAGGEPKTLSRGDHFVENCHIRNFSRVDRVYAPAVHLDGVGNRISHNLFHDSPHHAMRVEGWEHTVEFNEIHSVVYEADDQAGIDIFGNPAYRGNTIRYNFWHHIGSGHNVAGQAGIRLDDFISAVLIYGNVFYRCSGGHFGGVQIHGGKDNVVDNNLFVDCKYALSFSPWGEKRWLERLGDDRMKGVLRRSGMDITKPPFTTRYPDLAQMQSNADRNFVWRNAAVNCGQFEVRDRGQNEMMDNHAFEGDVGFSDVSKRDFTLKVNSPICERFGFRPIPFDEIGLYQSESRATWPVEHDVSTRYVQED